MVNAPIAQIRPDPANMLAALHIDGNYCSFLSDHICLIQELPLGTRDKAASPEIYARTTRRVGLMPDTVHADHWNTIGNRVPALNCNPRITLPRLLLCVILFAPADGGGIN